MPNNRKNGEKEEIERNKQYADELLRKIKGDLARARFELNWVQNAHCKLCEKGCKDYLNPEKLKRAEDLFDELMKIL